MVLLHELELDHVADSRGDGFRSVPENGRHAGCYGCETADYNLEKELDGVMVGRGGGRPTVCVAGPLAAAGARDMTCIWAAARPATTGRALMYFIMTICLRVDYTESCRKERDRLGWVS